MIYRRPLSSFVRKKEKPKGRPLALPRVVVKASAAADRNHELVEARYRLWKREHWDGLVLAEKRRQRGEFWRKYDFGYWREVKRR